METELSIPPALTSGALTHFECGVPIVDLNIERRHKERLARVDHVYWQWVKNPFLDVFPMFKQLCQGKYADKFSTWRAAQKDKFLFDFVVEHVATGSRRMDEAKVRKAAEQAIRIGMETDNVNALTRGGKLLYDVAGLDKPESEQADINRFMFLPPVITTSAREVDPTKEDTTDQQAQEIMKEYGAYVDDKRKAVEERVEIMMTARESDEQDRQ